MCFCCKKNIEDSQSSTEEDLENPKEEEEEEEEPLKEVSLRRLLAFEPKERPKLLGGAFLSFFVGFVFPLFSVILGEFMSVLLSKTGDELVKNINYMALGIFGLAVFSFTVNYLSNVLWMISGEKTSAKIRDKYFQILQKQEAAFYDKHSTGSFTISADIELIKGGISEKLGQCVYNVSQLIAGLSVAFYYCWKLTLVMLAISSLSSVLIIVQNRIVTRKTMKAQKYLGKVNQIVSETLTGIRTVYSFVSESFVSNKHYRLLSNARDNNKSKAQIQSLFLGFVMFLNFASYACGFYYGGHLVTSGELAPGAILSVFFSVLIGIVGLGQLANLMPDISKAQGSAARIFDLLDRTPLIDATEEFGVRLPSLNGKLSFQDIRFSYPTRPDTPVLRKFNLDITPGQTVALVGQSGSGKSTIVQLIERYYDALEGTILIDDVNIKELNLPWYRRNVGLVSQEPTLFSGTIKENILFGNPDATMEEVEEAAKLANAYEFIMSQPKGFNTSVGEKGTQLSGGQKQRLAIARAILKNPKILLLDEATSALDSESESLVQDALDKLMKGRTTIMVAHRLSTVKNADVIVVMKKGKVVEIGNHEELIELNGLYTSLVNKQMVYSEKKIKNSLKKSSTQQLRKSSKQPLRKSSKLLM